MPLIHTDFVYISMLFCSQLLSLSFFVESFVQRYYYFLYFSHAHYQWLETIVNYTAVESPLTATVFTTATFLADGPYIGKSRTCAHYFQVSATQGSRTLV